MGAGWKDGRRRGWHCWCLLPALLLACSHPAPPPDPGRGDREDGDAALAQGHPDEAVAAYRRALGMASDDLGALRGLMAAEVAAGDADAALETLDRLAAADPEPVDPCPVLELASKRRLERGDLTGAEYVSRGGIQARCTGSDLQLARVLDEQAVVAGSAGDLEAALALEREAIDLDPGQPARFERAAQLLLGEDRVGEAVTLLASGLEQHPENRGLRDLMVRALSIR